MRFDNFIKNLEENLNIARTHFNSTPRNLYSKQRKASFEQSLKLAFLLFLLSLVVILINNSKYFRSNLYNFLLIDDHPPVLIHRIIVPHNVSAYFTYNGNSLLVLHLELWECGFCLLVQNVSFIVNYLVVKLIILVFFLILWLLIFRKWVYLSVFLFLLLYFDLLSNFFESCIVINSIMTLYLENAHLVSLVK